jgi:hypothetical protein
MPKKPTPKPQEVALTATALQIVIRNAALAKLYRTLP